MTASVSVHVLHCATQVLLLLPALTQRSAQLPSLELQRLVQRFRRVAGVQHDLFLDHHGDCVARGPQALQPAVLLRLTLTMLLVLVQHLHLREHQLPSAEHQLRADRSRAW